MPFKRGHGFQCFSTGVAAIQLLTCEGFGFQSQIRICAEINDFNRGRVRLLMGRRTQTWLNRNSVSLLILYELLSLVTESDCCLLLCNLWRLRVLLVWAEVPFLVKDLLVCQNLLVITDMLLWQICRNKPQVTNEMTENFSRAGKLLQV